MHIKELLSDERDRLSSARVSWWVLLIHCMVMISLDTFASVDVPSAAYGLLGTLTVYTGVWAAGPRIAQWVAPQLGAIMSSFTNAVTTRLSGTDNARRDDERG